MSNDIATNQATNVLSSSASVTNRQTPAATTVDSGKVLPEQPQAQAVSAEELQQVVEQLNDHVQMIQRDLQFSVDDASGRTVIRVVNSETAELVRQIPSEEVLQISRSLKEQVDGITGLIVQTSA
ncbi:MAG: flagellar protein FlaG [Gammaproteobacteria bacterium]|nr:flagellar protein FlaG [Gammaproteobacteria bacterium]MCW8909028.1 flagellar protein FlaG [Gammaproteobacteria bacterium]MCW9005928.1 flagellar protein FlaG [Gammaproteobacteria bacterium]MCW9056176.1 flagellar protein FlaG [Gammaproteobacteria bacterium]